MSEAATTATTIVPTADGRIAVKRAVPEPTREERCAVLRAAADAEPHDYTCDCGHIRRRLVTPAGQAQRGGA